MKLFIILLLILMSLSIFSKTPMLEIGKQKNLFFIFSSDTNYEIKSSDETCIKVEDKYSSGKNVFQKAIYIKSLNYDNCKNKNLELIIKYGAQQEIIIPIVLNLNLQQIDKFTANKDLNAMFTPSGVLMIELNTIAKKSDLASQSKNNIPNPINSDNSKYKITFPWLCLEYCGGNSGAEIAEFARNKDALTSVSYERFTMDGGTWTTLNMTDPTPVVTENNLTAWPMIRSNSRTYDEDQMSTNLENIWINREVLATSMVNDAVNNNYTGYCMDIEFQTTRSATRDRYIQLVNFFSDKLHESGKKLMVAHAHWATMAPMSYLKDSSVDYVVTMDPYTASDLFFRKNGDETQGQAYEDYNQIEHNRLIWGFAWEYHNKSSQNSQWLWLQENGYNEGVVGAAVWRAPAENNCKSGCDTASEGINYYDAFKQYYPVDPNTVSLCNDITCSNHGICEEVDSQATCNCYEGYHSEGTTCIKDVEVCTSDITCSNHGICDDSSGVITCLCEEGYINAGLECLNNTTIKQKIIKTVNSEGFIISGAMPYFHNENIGLEDYSVWCYQNNIDSKNKLKLTFYDLAPAKYRVYTYIPSTNNLSTSVDYSINNSSEIKTSNVNQVNSKSDWAYLGEFDVNQNLEISVSCYSENTDINLFKKIYFSAIKLELLINE